LHGHEWLVRKRKIVYINNTKCRELILQIIGLEERYALI
jgi:hypothetical protein